jgi:hypothetical protein
LASTLTGHLLTTFFNLFDRELSFINNPRC